MKSSTYVGPKKKDISADAMGSRRDHSISTGSV